MTSSQVRQLVSYFMALDAAERNGTSFNRIETSFLHKKLTIRTMGLEEYVFIQHLACGYPNVVKRVLEWAEAQK